MAKPRIVPCPSCGAPVEWGPASLFRPFCSERCKMADLGDWATEKFRVPDPAPLGDGDPDEG